MKKILYTIAWVTLFLAQSNPSQAQAKVWRTIDLLTYPNDHLTSNEVGFRNALVEGIKTNKIKAYHYATKFARFAKPIDSKQLKRLLTYYDPDVQDSIPLRASDFTKIELQELYYPRKKGHKRFKIKAVTMIAKIDERRQVRLQFRYKDFNRYLNKVYKQTKQEQNIKTLRAYWQSPEDNTLQASVPAALENRKFVSKVTKTQKLKAKYKTQFGQLKHYRPTRPKNWSLTPKFMRIDQNQLRTSVRFMINLQDLENFPFYRQGQGFVPELTKGVKSGQLQAYQPNHSPMGKTRPMSKQRFMEQFKYFDVGLMDSILLRPGDLYKIYLEGDWNVNTTTKKIDFQAYKLILMIPQGTNDETQLGDMMVAQFEYAQLKDYFNARFQLAQKEGRYWSTWTNPQNTNEKMSFSEAFAKMLFKKRVAWFANQSDNSILNIISREVIKNQEAPKEKAKIYQKAQQFVMSYLENYGKK